MVIRRGVVLVARRPLFLYYSKRLYFVHRFIKHFIKRCLYNHLTPLIASLVCDSMRSFFFAKRASRAQYILPWRVFLSRPQPIRSGGCRSLDSPARRIALPSACPAIRERGAKEARMLLFRTFLLFTALMAWPIR